MLFLKNKEKKIIFGWSGKCGCSHIKRIFYFLENGQLNNDIHRPEEYNKEKLVYDENDTIIIFIRNPYERLVSGFLHQYANSFTVHARAQWRNDKELTFKNFVEELTTNRFKRINRHHFTSQLSENWEDSIGEREKTYFYDINKIPYDFLGILFDRKIPDELINFRGDHGNKNPVLDRLNFKVYDKKSDTFEKFRPKTSLFYNKEILRDVTIFYEKDLFYFNKQGFSYVLPE